MMPTRIPRLRASAELTLEELALSIAGEDGALFFYGLLDDKELKEVFGQSRVPADLRRVVPGRAN
jgi:hypothetical protein